MTLEGIKVTDVRPEAAGNPFRVLLAPAAASLKNAAVAAAPASASAPAGGGDAVEGSPLVTITATTSGDGGALDADVKLASFACNVMVDAIRDSLLVLLEVNVALFKMLGAIKTEAVGEDDRICGDPFGVLGVLDEAEGRATQVRGAARYRRRRCRDRKKCTSSTAAET